MLHCGVTRQKAAQAAGVGRATVQRDVAAFRDGGLDGLRRWDVEGQVSELPAYRDLIRESFEESPVRAASGRQRFNVPGARIAETNTTVVNTETISELLRKIAGLGLIGPITPVLDNARYLHNAAVKALAEGLGITLLFLPSYSPNLDLIERLWTFTKRRAVYGRYHPTFREFQAAIQETIDGIATIHAEPMTKLMTLKFQPFEDVSLLAG
ncbi:transposase [Singulisphaera rosea]